MSGGHYDYTWFKIETLADEIRNDLEKAMETEEFEKVFNSGFQHSFNGYLIEAIGPNSPARSITERTIKDLYRLAKQAKEVEWLLSGGTGVETFMEKYNKKQKDYGNPD